MAATEAQHRLRVFFIPLMSPGHMIPMIDMAKLFSLHGDSVTVVTTPANEPLVRPSIAASSATVDLLLLPFPPSVSHLLPNGHENLTSIPKSHHKTFFRAFFALQRPLDDLLYKHRPDCIVSNSMYTWTADTAVTLGIPRLMFHGPGAFPLCVHGSLHLLGTHKRVADDNQIFFVQGLPDVIQMRKSKLSAIFQWEAMLDSMKEAEEKSFGVVVNSFYGLEPAYAKLYRKKPGRKAWFVGPVSLANEDRIEITDVPEVERCMKWLDSMESGSVVYVCFGSLNEFGADQMQEIAWGLEQSGRPFVWVVRESSGWAADEGFEERTMGKGVIVRGWAPQTVILNHAAVGGFVTHCGWNSTVESVGAGVPMATWPVEYEQFVNEKLINEVLGIGVRVARGEGVVRREAVAKALTELMGGGREGKKRREKAKEYAAMAKTAVEEGGSSYVDVVSLIEELRGFRAP